MKTDEIVNQLSVLERKKAKYIDLCLLVFFLALFLGILITCFLLAEAYGADSRSGQLPRYILIVCDVTSVSSEEWLENERGVVRVLDGLQPGDEGQIMLITENTFSRPETVMRFRMPGKSGYFPEEIRGKKVEIINAFRQKVEGVKKSRPGTSILDAMWMFSKILCEQANKRRVLCIFSDMRQCLKGLNENTIVAKGDEILSKLAADSLIPDMKSIETYVQGVSTNGISLPVYKKLEEFWKNYFCKAGANLRCYDIGRNRVID